MKNLVFALMAAGLAMLALAACEELGDDGGESRKTVRLADVFEEIEEADYYPEYEIRLPSNCDYRVRSFGRRMEIECEESCGD